MAAPGSGRRGLLAALVRVALRLLLRLLPTRRIAVVYGNPSTEGNAVEVVRGLLDRYRGQVVWLADGPQSQQPIMYAQLPADTDTSRLRVVAHSDRRGVWFFLTAELVLFTHGIYLSPGGTRRKTHVNLWHGDGPKAIDAGAVTTYARSSLLVSGTRLWGQDKARHFAITPDRLLLTGNPRVDQFARPATDAELTALHLDPQAPLALWMPTYRQASAAGTDLWSDSDALLHSEAFRRDARQLVAMCRELGVTLRVKPHPLDVDAYQAAGLEVLHQRELDARGIGLYRLLARCAVLITDYSSVWSDFVALDRPVLFYCPDLDTYAQRRTFNVPDLAAVVPGKVHRELAGSDRNLMADLIPREAVDSCALRHRSVERVGAVTELGATDRLLDAIDDRQNASVPPPPAA
ncbi:MAG TPA: CDP-glycerol glycerophosphotransferase family protein [Mycobacteriales bacterium]|nr:CDP-glycerol glycerophosphotransferase family protein [Mycobacteriales bacterium]